MSEQKESPLPPPAPPKRSSSKASTSSSSSSLHKSTSGSKLKTRDETKSRKSSASENAKPFRWDTLQEESGEEEDSKVIPAAKEARKQVKEDKHESTRKAAENEQKDDVISRSSASSKEIRKQGKDDNTEPAKKKGSENEESLKKDHENVEKQQIVPKTPSEKQRKKSASSKLSRRQSGSSVWSYSTAQTGTYSSSYSSETTGSSYISKSGTSSATSGPHSVPPPKAQPLDNMSLISGVSGSVVGDGKSRILAHALKGEWSQVELIVRYCQKGDPEIFVIDDDTGVNPFMLAARDNRLVIVERLLELGVNINDRTRDGRNALHFAAGSAKEDVVNLLVKKRADCSLKGGEKEQLPLHMACARTGSDSRNVVQAILKQTPISMRTEPDKDGNIPLFLAIEAGNQGACKDLLTANGDQQLKYEKPGSMDMALHLACRRRDLEIVRLFSDYNIPVNRQNADGKTALHIAAYMGDEAIIKYLYTMKADPNVYDHMDRSPLHVAAEQGHTGVVEVLTDKFKSSVLARTKDGSTLMHIAAQCGHPETAMAFLKKGVPLHMPNKSGAVCLHAAAKNGHTVVVKALLTKGAYVDARTKDNFTALHVAVKQCRPLVVQMLLGYGAPVQVRGGKLQEAPLHLASSIKGGDKVAEMLLKSGAEPNSPREDGETPVHIASRNGYVDSFKLLLEEGGNLMLQSKSDENPLHVAVRHCRWPVVQEAVKFLAKQSMLDVAVCINMENKEGETSVHLAAELTSDRAHFEGEELKIMLILLQYGGDLNYSTKLTQETPLHYAARSGNENILRIFIDKIGASNMPTTINRQAKNGWSPLLFASEEGHENCVYDLLKQQARVDVFDENGKAALHLAAENGRLEIAAMLLKYKAFVNAKTKLGFTPLHLAAQNGYNELVKMLIERHDAAIDARSLDKKTPLHKAAENGQFDVCESLLRAGANVQMVDNKGQTPLHLAAENDHSKVVEQFLKHQPELVIMTNKAGSTCAHIAAAKGSVAVIAELLKFDPQNVTKFRNRTYQTALLLAAKGGHADVVRELIASGANVMDEDADGMNALHLIAKYGHTHVIEAIKNFQNNSWRIASSKTGFNALHVATQFGKEEFAREMLIFISATVPSEPCANRQDNVKEGIMEYGFTPLHLASQSGHVNLVRMILNYPGVNVAAGTTPQNMTPLHLAAQCGHTAVVGLLLSKDLEQLSSKDAQGFTSLHYAACNGHLEMVSLLLGQGAEINSFDKNNWTPLHLAAKSGSLEMVKLLTEGGADTTSETNQNKTPLQHAAAAGHYRVVSYLLKQNHNTYALIEDRTFVADLMQIAVASSTGSGSSAPAYMAVQGGSTPTPVPSGDSRPVTPRGRAGRVPGHLLPKVAEERLSNAAGAPVASEKKMEILQEFVLVSPAPLETAAKLSRAFMLLSNRIKEQAKGLQECARYSETLAVELLGICSAPKGAHDILKATDNKGVPFLDVLIDCEQKNVIADPAVQKYLSDVWVGNLKWSDARLILLCFSFLICPVLWIFFSLPIEVRLNKVPIIKFIVYLVSHMYLVILFVITCAVPLDPIYAESRLSLIPKWYEWLLLVWVSGVLVNELTSPTDRTGIGWVRTLILTFCAIGVVVHLIGFAFTDDKTRQEIIYARNMFLSAAMTLSFVQFLEFLSFHYLFGPWSIIIEGLLKDLFKFGVIVLMFMVAFTMWLAAVYQPVYDCVDPQDYCPNKTTPILDNGVDQDPGHIQHPGYTFQLFFFSLFGLIEPDLLPPITQNPTFTIYLVQFVFGLYNIIMLIVLINLLIAMMSDTYQRIEAQSDTEWKFGRSKLIRNMKKTTLSPAPLNLLTTFYQAIKICLRHRGRVCDPNVELSTDYDDLESLPDSRSPDAHINQTWRLRKGKAGNGVSPSASPMPPLDEANTRTSLNRQKSLQDIVRWKEIRQKYWTAKGKDMSQDFDPGTYAVLGEKGGQDTKYDDRPNGGILGNHNGGGSFTSYDMTSLTHQSSLPGEVIENSPALARKDMQ